VKVQIFFKDQGVLALTSEASIDFTCDDFDAPLTNAQRAYLRSICGVDIPQVFWRKQIHGDDILVAQKFPKSCPDADAFITNETNLPIAIRTADCVPVFIYDPNHHAMGLAHAGWRGTQKAIAAKTVQKMHEKYGSRSADLKIVLGPSIRKCCYQVGPEFREYFPSHLCARDGHWYLDALGANRDQLLQAGVLKENIFDSQTCTCCDKNYFSHRRDGAKAGRMISVMMLQ